MKMARYSRRWVVGLVAGVVAGLVVMLIAGCAGERRAQFNPEGIPPQVMAALKAKFPKADIQKWTRETEGDILVYDIEITQAGRKFEADIKADGSIHNWEMEIAIQDLPEAVKKAVEATYPKSTLKEVMAITAVKDGQDALEGYEILFQTASGKAIEVTVAPDGKILEAPGE